MSPGIRLIQVCCAALLVLGSLTAIGNEIVPSGGDGRPLNLDFETGDLRDWKAEGDAFEGQPVRGDTVHARRNDMFSGHLGTHWLGGYERHGDARRGVLTSETFTLTQPWACLWVGGGATPGTRVELISVDTQKPVLAIHGNDQEQLRPVVAELKEHMGKRVFLRIVDEETGHWGHINFDGMRMYSSRPSLPGQVMFSDFKKSMPPPADEVTHAGLLPAEAVRAATLPPGFKLHLAAGEPDVRQPIAFCEDDRGRLWVAEGHTYPRRAPEGEGRDRILVFEDTDGDHRLDRRTVFMENLNLISGLEYGFGGIWVGAAPHLMFIPVIDGDVPRPGGQPRVLLDGWDFKADTHETLNTFSWGPDGWLYGCHGVFCPSWVGKPGATDAERQWVDCAVWRYHPVRHRFEIFSEGTSNPWGLDFDAHGQAWIEACVIPHLWHMIQGGRYERQGGEHFCVNAEETERNLKPRDSRSKKPVYPHWYEDIKTVADHVHYAGIAGPHAANGRSDSAGGGHAHAGMMVYLGTSWPEKYRGNLFIGNIHGQRINMDVPVRSGSGFIGKHGPDFLHFNDRWSQTLNHRMDPDGSVYIIDWYDKNQCHHNNVDGHDRSNGRIYKIVHGDQKVSRVDVATGSDAQLSQWVISENEWLSRHARRVLQERWAVDPARAASSEILRELVKRSRTGSSSRSRLQALWAVHRTSGLTAYPDWGVWLEHEDEWVRSWALQLIQSEVELGMVSDASAVSAKLRVAAVRMASDASPLVRRHVASTVQRWRPENRVDVLQALLAQSGDAGDHNLPLLYWYATEGVVATQPAEAIRLLESCRIPKVREFISRRLTSAGLVTQ